jgi:hypothetical protein
MTGAEPGLLKELFDAQVVLTEGKVRQAYTQDDLAQRRK